MEKHIKSKVEDVLSEKQICHILRHTVKDPFKIVGCALKPANEGLSGFLGDHFKIVLDVEEENTPRKIHLFVKTLPLVNKPKADFIDKYHFFRREALLYKMFQEVKGDGANVWCAKAYLYADDRIVLDDISEYGYISRPVSEYLDIDHMLVIVKSVAKYHAYIADCMGRYNFDTRELCKRYDGFKHYLQEPTWKEGPWLRVAAKVAADFLNEFSVKYKNDADLEDNLAKLFIQACNTLNNNQDTLNVVIHKDLWVNNFMFKYENNVPTNAILVDFQCATYAPPAFDVMILLYLNTSKEFRQRYESEVFDRYFLIFLQNVNEYTKRHIEQMGYNRDSLKEFCKVGRMYALVQAIGIFPYTLLDPHTAKSTYDDPENFDKYQFESRSEPVLAYARRCNYFREKLLKVCEEFVERYILCTYAI